LRFNIVRNVILQASKQWQWKCCNQKNRLLVDLDSELQLCTPFRPRQLIADIKSEPYFSIDEALFYQNVFNYLLRFDVWSEPECCQIALNATAVKFYLLPVQAKSWFFERYQGSENITEAFITLKSLVDKGDFFIVDQSNDCVLCLCLSESFKLDEHLLLEQFQAIKVLNDRVYPLEIHTHKKQLA
jgi:cell division protein ZapC